MLAFAQEYLDHQGRDVFSRKDINADNIVSQKEHMQFEIKQGAMSALEAESVFEELDKSQDGLLTRVEHRGIHGVVDFDAGDPGEKSAEFDAIDANSDGGIDASEWTDFQTIHSRGLITAEQIHTEFIRHDFDNNGQVSLDEYFLPLSAKNEKIDL